MAYSRGLEHPSAIGFAAINLWMITSSRRTKANMEILPTPISAVSLLSSPHFGRVFSENVRIKINGDAYAIELSSGGQLINLTNFNNNSFRAERYGWVVRPDRDTNGVLTEAIVHLHGLQHDFFSVSLISHERGLLTLRHNTVDKNIGWLDIGAYLEDAYRIDRWLSRINDDLARFEASCTDIDLGSVRKAKSATYMGIAESVVDALLPGGLSTARSRSFINGRDVFESREMYDAFIAFSIAVRFADFAFESGKGCRHYVTQNLAQFPEGRFDQELALRFINRRGKVCTVSKFQSFIQWYSFSCRL